MKMKARTVNAVAWWVLAGTNLTAQAQPLPTQIGQHRMGETFEEARKILGFDLDFICQPKHTRAELRTGAEGPLFIYDFKQECKDLSHIRLRQEIKVASRLNAWTGELCNSIRHETCSVAGLLA